MVDRTEYCRHLLSNRQRNKAVPGVGGSKVGEKRGKKRAKERKGGDDGLYELGRALGGGGDVREDTPAQNGGRKRWSSWLVAKEVARGNPNDRSDFLWSAVGSFQVKRKVGAEHT